MKVIDASVLVEHLAGGEFGEQAERAVTRERSIHLQRVLHQHLVQRAWELRDNVIFYDGLYVALAEELDSPLLTRKSS